MVDSCVASTCSESVKDMSSGPTAPVDEGVGTPEEEVDLSQEPGVVRRPHNGL